MTGTPSDVGYWQSSLHGLNPDDHGGDAPEIMLRRVWGFSDEQYQLHANEDNRDVMCLQVQDFPSAEDIQAHVEATVVDDLETLRLQDEGREFMRTAPEGLVYRVWIDNVRREPDDQPKSTIFAFEREQLADFADTAMPGKSLLAKAWRDSTTLTTVARLCSSWFKKEVVPGEMTQMKLFDQVAP